jgi:hypothetical protein
LANARVLVQQNGANNTLLLTCPPFGVAAFVHAGPATAPIATDAAPGASWKSYISCSPFTSEQASPSRVATKQRLHRSAPKFVSTREHSASYSSTLFCARQPWQRRGSAVAAMIESRAAVVNAYLNLACGRLDYYSDYLSTHTS